MSNHLSVCLDDILMAHSRIQDHIHQTPVFTSHTFNASYGRKFYFKAENLQKTGSFKARGALNAVTALSEDRTVPGVITHSTGNHGQALAWAAKVKGLKCVVVVPRDSPTVKLEAILGYGAEVVLCEPNPVARQLTCDQLAKEKGYHFIPPYDDNNVIAGQGTIAVEFLKQVPELNAIFVPTSGGGLISGIAIAAKAIKPDIKVFLVEPEGKDAQKCLMAGERLWPNPPRFVETIADGIRTQQLGHMTWPIILELVEKQVFSVKNEDIIKGMKFASERMKLVIEGASGAGVAAAMSDKMRDMDDSLAHVGVVLCGGNVDIDHLPWYQ